MSTQALARANGDKDKEARATAKAKMAAKDGAKDRAKVYGVNNWAHPGWNQPQWPSPPEWPPVAASAAAVPTQPTLQYPWMAAAVAAPPPFAGAAAALPPPAGAAAAPPVSACVPHSVHTPPFM